MNFASIMRSITVGQACKRPSWQGYCEKHAAASTDKMADNTTPVSYWIWFKQRDRDVFKYRVDASGNIEFVTCVPASGSGSTSSSKLEMDAQLLQGMLASDWVSGTPADFDAVAEGDGVW